MIFQEKKAEEGFEYLCEDVFGTIELQSPIKLDANMLDQVSVFIIHQQAGAAETVEGTIKPSESSDKVISYTFSKAPQWTDPDPDEDKPRTISRWARFKQWIKNIRNRWLRALKRRIDSMLQ